MSIYSFKKLSHIITFSVENVMILMIILTVDKLKIIMMMFGIMNVMKIMKKWIDIKILTKSSSKTIFACYWKQESI